VHSKHVFLLKELLDQSSTTWGGIFGESRRRQVMLRH